MQRFAVVLFALVALFAIGSPSSVNALSQMKRETNADRFARGLTPLPPSRRATAKRSQNSQASVNRSGRVQVRDHGNGQSRGYLQPGPNGIGLDNNPQDSDFSVRYNSHDKSLFCLGSHFKQGGHYLGGAVTPHILNAGSTYYVPLTNVDAGNPDYETAIWTIDNTGKLTANWENVDNTNVPVSCAFNDAENSIVLVGDINDFCDQNPDYKPVDLYIVH